jgi:alkanesulfonate monooxygenase SsuD/methylene tetrahydromethanopterin reductase-like flavin-dependent oxidoreductase (luciferase family)
MPPETRARLGIGEAVAERIRDVMLRDGIDAAGALVPPAVVARSALVGSADEIGARLRAVRDEATPELFLLPLNEHEEAEAFIDRAARLLDTAGFRAAGAAQ